MILAFTIYLENPFATPISNKPESFLGALSGFR